MLENLDKIMHSRFNFDACPMHSPFWFMHLMHQNLSVPALSCLNSLAKVNTQLLIHKCDLLSQNEHKVATAAFQNYYRFKFFIMHALKWYMICGYSSLFCSAKINILCWFSFVFFCSVTHKTGYISVYKLATLPSFSDSRSQTITLTGIGLLVSITEVI